MNQEENLQVEYFTQENGTEHNSIKYTKQAREGGERSGYEIVKKWLRSYYPKLVLSLILNLYPKLLVHDIHDGLKYRWSC